MNPSRSRRTGYLIGSISVAANLVLFAMKLWAGSRSESVAMVADAWHTMSDSFTSLVVIAGFWLSGLPGDREHPFGHGRAEGIGAVVIGTLLAVVGAGFVRESIQQLASRDAVRFDLSSVVIFSASVVLKETMASVSIRTGKRIGSQSLVADGWHHRSDAVASGMVLLGILLGRSLWWIDGAAGLAVSALILYAAWGIVKSAADTILGERPPDDIVRHIRRFVRESLPEVTDVHRMSYHRYGDHREMSLHAVMPDHLDLTASHRLATELEREVRERFGVVATVHAEPASDALAEPPA